LSTGWWSEALTAAEPEDGWLPGAFNRGWSYRERVGPDGAGMGLVAYYSARHRHSPAEHWQQRLANGEISRNGMVLQRDLTLRCGDRLIWHRAPWWEGPVPAALPIRFDDGDLLVLDKPSGLPVLPAGGWLEHTVLRLLERRHRSDGAPIPRPVHRLGRFTSGLLVCARQPASRAWLSAQLRDSTAQLLAPAAGGVAPAQRPAAPGSPVPGERGERAAAVVPVGPSDGEAAPLEPPAPSDPAGSRPSLEGRGRADATGGGARKVYRALLPAGALDLAPGSSRAIAVPIGRHGHPKLGQVWAAGGAGALPAFSRLTLLEARAEGDLVEVVIESGRPHQIRIHCAALGAPLLGDPLYRPGGLPNPASLPGAGGYRLHALALRLSRPDGGVLDLWAPPPPLLRCRADDPAPAAWR
jgi:23S rRNA pseudouridine1911/1915/1917 synthase